MSCTACKTEVTMKNYRLNQKGAALVTTLFFLIVVTLLAAGSLMLATVQVKVSGSVARWESSLVSSEGGIGYVIPLIQYAHFESKIPAGYCYYLNRGCPPPPAVPDLIEQMHGNPANPDGDGDPSSPTYIAPDITIPAGSPASLNGLEMDVDIDLYGTAITSGAGIEASWAYHGSSYGSSTVTAYKVTGTVRTSAGGSRGRVNQILWLRSLL